MTVDMFSRRNRLTGIANQLAVFPNSATARNLHQGDFMARADRLGDCQCAAAVHQFVARLNSSLQDGDVVGVMKNKGDGGKASLGHWVSVRRRPYAVKTSHNGHKLS